MSERTDAHRGKAPVELRLAVWQFVRIMVQLETAARARGKRGAPSLYGAWRPAWQEIDRRLTQLGQSDAAGFADLMMEQEVVLQCRNRAQLNELIRTVDNVVNQLKTEIRAAAGDAGQVTDLRFERTDLETLGRHLRKLTKVAGRGSSSPKGRSASRSTGRRGAAR